MGTRLTTHKFWEFETHERNGKIKRMRRKFGTNPKVTRKELLKFGKYLDQIVDVFFPKVSDAYHSASHKHWQEYCDAIEPYDLNKTSKSRKWRHIRSDKARLDAYVTTMANFLADLLGLD